jgi:protein-histidine pros-kinase
MTLFFDERAKLMPGLQSAIDRNDAGEVEQIAHSLKSSIGIFSSGSAFIAIGRLEAMGRDGNISNAGAVWRALAEDLDYLEAELRAYLEAESC